MDKLNRQELNLQELERIPIPEGLEERLSQKIDEWEQAEKKPRRISFPKPLRYVSAAASIALLFGVGYYFLHQEEPTIVAEQDTYHDPLLAQQEAEKALTLLAANLNKGMGHLEKAKALSDRTETTLNEQLNILKK